MFIVSSCSSSARGGSRLFRKLFQLHVVSFACAEQRDLAHELNHPRYGQLRRAQVPGGSAELLAPQGWVRGEQHQRLAFRGITAGGCCMYEGGGGGRRDPLDDLQ